MGCKGVSDLEMLVALHESGNDYGGMSAMASDLEEMSGNFLRRTILVMKLGGFHNIAGNTGGLLIKARKLKLKLTDFNLAI